MNETLWGDVLCGIDNHFQLLLYINENHCQLETKTFLRKFLRNANKARYHAISKYKKIENNAGIAATNEIRILIYITY
ncbi:hypothetical protein ERS140248_00018 [Staphylococcus argenteus]|nr:hypothetical protein ERS140248_00018 [Staphylococcus argenteus]